MRRLLLPLILTAPLAVVVGTGQVPAPRNGPPHWIATSRRPIRASRGRPCATLPAEGVTATLIDMTSQRWLTEQEVEQPLWKHWLAVIRPADVKSDIALLFISGGRNDRDAAGASARLAGRAARDTGTVVAELRMVPNQPVVFKDDPAHKPRTEDDFIAYTWDKFLRTGDESWPARLPMTKSAVRAMDAVTAFSASPAGGGTRSRRFVVVGRIEARLDDLDDGRGRSARHRDRPGGDRPAERRAVVRPPLPRLRRVVGRGQGLRRAGGHGLDRHAAVPRADEDRGALRVSRSPDHARSCCSTRRATSSSCPTRRSSTSTICPARSTFATCRTPTTRSTRPTRSKPSQASTPSIVKGDAAPRSSRGRSRKTARSRSWRRSGRATFDCGRPTIPTRATSASTSSGRLTTARPSRPSGPNTWVARLNAPRRAGPPLSWS